MDKRDVIRPTDSVNLNTTPEQDERLREAGDKIVANGGIYNPITNNCAAVTRNQLVYARLLLPPIPGDKFTLPWLVEYQVRVTTFLRSLFE